MRTSVRVAVSFRVPFSIQADVDPEIRAAVERIAGVLGDLGHEVFAADPDYGVVGASFLPRGTAGSADWFERIPNPHVERATRTEVRIGRTMAGWPIGAQLLGRPCDEATLLRIGAELERVERWWERWPPIAGLWAER